MKLTVTCAIVLEQNDKILLVQEATPEIYGKWNQPAGHLEAGETLFECAIRECREESGYAIELSGLQAIYTEVTDQFHRFNFCFRARPLGEPGLVDPSEILSTRWFTKAELQQLPDDNLRHNLAKQRIADWLAGKVMPLDTIAPMRWID